MTEPIESLILDTKADAMRIVAARLRLDSTAGAAVIAPYMRDAKALLTLVAVLADCIAELLSGDDFADVDVAKFLEELATQ